jgi:hypothetical protein
MEAARGKERLYPGKSSSHAKAPSSPRFFNTLFALGYSPVRRSGDFIYPIVFLGEFGALA